MGIEASIVIWLIPPFQLATPVASLVSIFQAPGEPPAIFICVPEDVILAVLPSSSKILSTILFQELDDSHEPVPTLSFTERREFRDAYPIERIVTVRKKANPVMIPFFQGEEGFIAKNEG